MDNRELVSHPRIYDPQGYLYGFRQMTLQLKPRLSPQKKRLGWDLTAMRSLVGDYQGWGDGSSSKIHIASHGLRTDQDSLRVGLRDGSGCAIGLPYERPFSSCSCGFYAWYQANTMIRTPWVLSGFSTHRTISALVMTRSHGKIAHHQFGFRAEKTQVVYGKLIVTAESNFPRIFSEIVREAGLTVLRGLCSKCFVKFGTSDPTKIMHLVKECSNPNCGLVDWLDLQDSFATVTEAYQRFGWQPSLSDDPIALPAQIRQLRQAVRALPAFFD